MADEQQQPDRDSETAPVTPTPSEGDIFGTAFAHEPAEDDLFASVAESASPRSHRETKGFPQSTSPRTPRSRRNGFPDAVRRVWNAGHLSRVQKILVASILAIAIALLYVLIVRTPLPLPSERRNGTESPSEEQASTQRAGRASAPAQERHATAAGSTRGGDPKHETSRLGTPATSRGPESHNPRGTAASAPQAASAEPVESSLGDNGRASALGPERGAATYDQQGNGSSAGPRTLPSPEPLSLQLADKLYLRRDYEHALAMYDKLYRRLPATEENQPLRDFLLLRMALCSKNGGNVAQADTLLRTVSLSRLPILRALARYHQSTALVSRKRHLEAATKAYQTMALIEVAGYDKKWVSAVQQQCGYLAAEAVTRNLLSLCDADANLPAALWSEHPDLDPFVDMGEPQLRVFLASGVEQLEGTVLSPQIRRVGDDAVAPRWSVICNGASLEELLARFATNAKVNVRWPDTGQALSAEDNVRVRPVYLYLTSATALQVVTTAVGSVGLVAQTDEKGNLRVLDPTSYSSLADHTNLLAEEALTLWRRFLLAAENDPRATNAHFAMALLQAARGQFDEAIAEYKLVANRYAKHALAPQALLRSGTLKVRLRDYVGAHADLKQLVELYPESDLAGRACLSLADATMKAGLYQEASGLYRKVYNLGSSAESQTESALGAGRCLYEIKEYEEAAKWLSRYVTLARDQSRPGFSTACLLLGKAYLALHQPRQAQAALNLAIKGELSHQQHVETVAVLVRTYIEQGLFLEALSTLEGTGGWQLSLQEAVELMLLRAQAFRSIGLADKGIALLEEKSQYLPSPELQVKVSLELAKCHTESGNLESARKTLGQAFATVEPGPLAYQIGRELVGVCLRLGQTAQAVSVCSQLLERAPASERQAIQALLADAYRKQGQYDQAVAAMLDGYEAPGLIKDN